MLLVKMLRSTSTAIVLFLLGGAALFSLPMASAASIKTYPNFFSAEEVEQFASSVDVDKGGNWYTAKQGRSVITLDAAISRRLRDATGTATTAEEQRQYRRSIPVTKIMGSTEPHVDMHIDSGEPVEGEVAFVFLNDNSDATFVHGSTEIAAEAGKLVVFDGDVPHNTQISRGTLALAGPIHLRSLTAVAACVRSCETDSDCSSDLSTPVCDCNGPDASCGVSRLLEQRSQFLRKLEVVHEREVSAEEEMETSDGHAADINFDALNRRRLSKGGSTKSGKSCGSSCGACVAKSTKSPKGGGASDGSF